MQKDKDALINIIFRTQGQEGMEKKRFLGVDRKKEKKNENVLDLLLSV